jgi:hypothetical protein
LRFADVAMLVLRKGGQFTDSQINKYFFTALIFFGCAILALTAIRYIQIPFVGLAAVVLAVAAFKKNVRRWGNWTAGKRGELAVTEALQGLCNNYVVLNDLTFPDAKGNVDHLVIGPNGLFVIETKNYTGRVKCLGDQWFINGHRTKSLSRQAKSNALAVRSNLAMVFAEHQAKLPYVVPLLVFVHCRGGLNLKNPTIPVLKSGQLAGFIQNYKPANYIQHSGGAELKRAIVHHLHMLQRMPEKPPPRAFSKR